MSKQHIMCFSRPYWRHGASLIQLLVGCRWGRSIRAPVAHPLFEYSMPQQDNDIGGQISRFAIIGVLNTCFGLAVILFFYRVLGSSLIVSNAAGYGMGLVLSFALNGFWTFDASTYKLTMVIKYLLLVGAAFIINMLVIMSLMSLGLPYWIAQIVGVITYSSIVFLGMKYAVFTK